MAEDAKVVEKHSICFCCQYAMVMAGLKVQQSPAPNPLTQKIEIRESFRESEQIACLRGGGPLLIGERFFMQSCTEFKLGPEKQFKTPGHMDAAKSIQ